MSELIQLLLFVTLGSVAGIAGGILFLIKKEWTKLLSKIATPLAAGVLLTLSLLDLFPEAVGDIGEAAFTIVLFVFVSAFLVERFLFEMHHHDSHRGEQLKSTAAIVIIGDTVHNFLDGVAITAAFLVEPTFGFVVALATFLHETPHEIADFGILVANGWSRRSTFLANLFSSLATFPGAFLTFYFAEKVEGMVGILLATAAGLFLYLASTDFLPETIHKVHKNQKTKWIQAVFFLIGVVIMFLIVKLVPHGQTPESGQSFLLTIALS